MFSRYHGYLSMSPDPGEIPGLLRINLYLQVVAKERESQNTAHNLTSNTKSKDLEGENGFANNATNKQHTPERSKHKGSLILNNPYNSNANAKNAVPTSKTKQNKAQISNNPLAKEPIPPLPDSPSLSLNPLLFQNPRQIQFPRPSRNINRRRSLNTRLLPKLKNNITQHHHRSRQVSLEETQHLLADAHVFVADRPRANPELRHENQTIENQSDVRAYHARLRSER
jgi:hypothetical protein